LHKITDPLFFGAIQAVSAKGELFFTERQLYWEVARFVEKRTLPGCSLGKKKGAQSQITRPKLSRFEFEKTYLNRWIEVHGIPEKLIRPTPEKRTAPPIPEELQSYSFDRALVVEDAQIAQMLVKNRFHFENNCAILSLDQTFPAAPTFETVLAMLQRNPNLVVFALHDCDAEGVGMPTRLRGPEWFPDLSVRILDLGLRPSQLPTKGVLGESIPVKDGLPAIAQALPESDRLWLSAGNRVALSFLRPGKLMKSIYLGFSQASQYASGDAWVDSGYGFFYIGDPYPIWGPSGFTGTMDAGGYDSFG
jgi:hypothetical protein